MVDKKTYTIKQTDRYFINKTYKRDSDNDDDDTKSTAPTATASAATEADCFEVCLMASREGFALVFLRTRCLARDVQTMWLLLTSYCPVCHCV